MSDIQRRVLCAMQPGCFYRIVDIRDEIGVRYGQARYAMSRLVRGG